MKLTKDGKKSLLKIIASVLVIGVIIAVAYIIFDALGITKLSREQIQDFVSSTGAIAPLAFIFISFLQVTFVPIPGMVTILAGNYLFGPWLSFLYSYIGMMIGSVVAWVLGRLLGRPYINWVAGSKEQADEWMKKLKGREIVFLFFAFLLPLFPDDLLCSIAGILPVRFGVFFIMQIITRFTSIGASLLFMSGEVIPFHGWGLWVIGALIILSIVAFIVSIKHAEKINQIFNKVVDGINNKFKKKSNKKVDND